MCHIPTVPLRTRSPANTDLDETTASDLLRIGLSYQVDRAYLVSIRGSNLKAYTSPNEADWTLVGRSWCTVGRDTIHRPSVVHKEVLLVKTHHLIEISVYPTFLAVGSELFPYPMLQKMRSSPQLGHFLSWPEHSNRRCWFNSARSGSGKSSRDSTGGHPLPSAEPPNRWVLALTIIRRALEDRTYKSAQLRSLRRGRCLSFQSRGITTVVRTDAALHGAHHR